MSATASFIAATIMSAGPWAAQGVGIAGLLHRYPSPGSAAGRGVFPVRIPQQAWERVNTLIAGRVNDSRVGTAPLQGEPDLLAGGLDLSTLEVAGCQPDPAVSVSLTAPTPRRRRPWRYAPAAASSAVETGGLSRAVPRASLDVSRRGRG